MRCCTEAFPLETVLFGLGYGEGTAGLLGLGYTQLLNLQDGIGHGLDVIGPGLDLTGPGLDVIGPGLDMTGPGLDVTGPGLDVTGPGFDG